ncbi:hypothetical protein DBW_0890 [Desulfuromonas sp. DDH964]|nr:hypothetical protein DBW_0890 [Desulfuromonas sp. DDH964]
MLNAQFDRSGDNLIYKNHFGPYSNTTRAELIFNHIFNLINNAQLPQGCFVY